MKQLGTAPTGWLPQKYRAAKGRDTYYCADEEETVYNSVYVVWLETLVQQLAGGDNAKVDRAIAEISDTTI
jgi:hypothetical protein